MNALIIVFKAIWLFVKVFCCGLFKVNNPFGWTWKKWMQGHTFRTTGQKSRTDFLAVPRYWVRAVRKIFDNRNFQATHQAEAIYCQSTSQEAQFSNYLKAVSGRDFKFLIYRDDSPHGMALMNKVVLFFLTSVIALVLFFCSLFARHRSRLGLMLLQWVENVMMMTICSRWGVQKLYFFGGYENDSCFTGLLARSMNVHLVTIPSANPIRNFYQQVVTDTFVITADFQNTEYKKYNHQWLCGHLEQWPFIEFSKLSPFIKPGDNTNKMCIGLLSRGAWLRKKRSLFAQNNNRDFEYEERCMDALRNFLKSHPMYTLVILPHPMECHRPDIKLEAVDYYNDYFAGLSIVFYDKGLKSYQCFSDVDVTVTAISSANIERLYCGYKAMFAPLGAEMEFFSGSTLDNIVCRTEEAFDKMLSDILSKNEEEFFQHYQLQPYRFDSIRTQR
jgi:hypothetical protein